MVSLLYCRKHSFIKIQAHKIKHIILNHISFYNKKIFLYSQRGSKLHCILMVATNEFNIKMMMKSYATDIFFFKSLGLFWIYQLFNYHIQSSSMSLQVGRIGCADQLVGHFLKNYTVLKPIILGKLRSECLHFSCIIFVYNWCVLKASRPSQHSRGAKICPASKIYLGSQRCPTPVLIGLKPRGSSPSNPVHLSAQLPLSLRKSDFVICIQPCVTKIKQRSALAGLLCCVLFHSC